MVHYLRLQTFGVAALASMAACAAPNAPAQDDTQVVDVQLGRGGEADTVRADTLGAIQERLSIVDEIDAPCPTRGSTIAAEPTEGDPIIWSGLARVGTRWVTAGLGDEGFSAFDGNASVLPAPVSGGELNRVAAVHDRILLASAAKDAIEVTPFDAMGRPQGPAAKLASARAYSLATGAGAENALVAWSTGASVSARMLDRTGAPQGEAFALEPDAAQDSWAASIAPGAGNELAIAWSDRRHDGAGYRLYFAFVKPGGVSGLVRQLATSDKPLAVAKLSQTSAGYALLLKEPYAASRSHVVVAALDARGYLRGTGRRLGGAIGSYDLAANGDALGLVARSADGGVAYRALDPSTKPIGSWVCLGDADDAGNDPTASIAADGDGYAVLRRTSSGATAFGRIDRHGAWR